jgi:hypothetical protein
MSGGEHWWYERDGRVRFGIPTVWPSCEIALVHHRLAHRIRAHALICFLALVLYRVTRMRMRLKARGHSASPRTALDLLSCIRRHNARIAKRTLEGITIPSPEQLELFDTLNLPKPA